MNIYEALQGSHRRIESLLDQLVESSRSGNDQWKTVLVQLRHELIPHAHAEEAVFYNTLREIEQSKDVVAHAYTEHATAETEIRALGAAKLIDANWTRMAEKLREDVRHHITDEESKIFAKARQVLSDAEATQIGAAFERLKAEMTKDADSVIKSTIDLVSNLMPERFRKKHEKVA